MKSSYKIGDVEYLPCIGEPESVKTRKQGRVINENLYKKDTPIPLKKATKDTDGVRKSSFGLRLRRKNPEGILINNCNRIINFKYSTSRQKELAQEYLDTRKRSLISWINKITRSLSLQYNKDF